MTKMTAKQSTFWVMPSDLNPFGTLFGGVMMSWMDKVAVLTAMEHTGRNCVTLFVDQIKFHAPVRIQEVVDMSAEVYEEGITSVMVHVQARKRVATEEFEKGVLVAESIFKFVAMDANGRPTDKWERRKRDLRAGLARREVA